MVNTLATFELYRKSSYFSIILINNNGIFVTCLSQLLVIMQIKTGHKTVNMCGIVSGRCLGVLQVYASLVCDITPW